MTKNELDKRVTSIDDCIIEVPLCEVFVDNKSIGFHNEYTVRRIQLAVKRGEIPNNVTFLFKGKESRMIYDEKRDYVYLKPNFMSGFYDISYILALELMD